MNVLSLGGLSRTQYRLNFMKKTHWRRGVAWDFDRTVGNCKRVSLMRVASTLTCCRRHSVTSSLWRLPVVCCFPCSTRLPVPCWLLLLHRVGLVHYLAVFVVYFKYLSSEQKGIYDSYACCGAENGWLQTPFLSLLRGSLSRGSHVNSTPHRL